MHVSSQARASTDCSLPIVMEPPTGIASLILDNFVVRIFKIKLVLVPVQVVTSWRNLQKLEKSAGAGPVPQEDGKGSVFPSASGEAGPAW